MIDLEQGNSDWQKQEKSSSMTVNNYLEARNQLITILKKAEDKYTDALRIEFLRVLGVQAQPILVQ